MTGSMARLDRLVPRLRDAFDRAEPRPMRGRVRAVRGVVVHVSMPSARIGELCQLRDPSNGHIVPAEVIGFAEGEAILAPIGDLEGLSAHAEVIPSGRPLRIPVGDGLLGRVIDPLGRFLDDGPAADWAGPRYPVHAEPPPPLSRQLIEHVMPLGVRAIDSLLTVGRGQRIGIFGEPGVGKSSLLAAIVRGAEADVIVIGLVGERGREVRDFLDVQLGAAARARSVVVVATSDRPATERAKAPYTATTIAEYFRDRGLNVLLLMDSITRFARAQREMGLAAGEPPTRRGFPPSFFAALPRLLERAGPGARGTITAIYTVLTEGDGALDPVGEEVKSILDGHIVLSPDLAQRNHFPAIDILRSRSRVMDQIVTPEHQAAATAIRDHMAAYAEVELLIRIGEYEEGSDRRIDRAVARHHDIGVFLRQAAAERSDMEMTLRSLREIAA